MLKLYFNEQCLAFQTGKVTLLPIKRPPVQKIERYFYYFDIRWGDNPENTFVQQRPPGDIWHGLFELPLLETTKPIPQKELRGTAMEILHDWFGVIPDTLNTGENMVHKLTHRTIKALFFQAKYASKPIKKPETMHSININDIKALPVSRLIDRYLSKM